MTVTKRILDPETGTFLVSFLVDARGGAMNGSRYPGLRIVIPPNAASAPTRVTCRLMRQGRVSRPPQFNDGEGLACRIIEMGPSNATFNGNVLLEVPHFASLRDREREIVVLRSDNGDTWKEHTVEVTEQGVLDAVGGFFSPLETNEELRKKRVVRILTNSFPQYFALVTRVRQESALIGPEGGVISSTVIGQVQAVFPEGALTKKIRVGIQALPVQSELVSKMLGNRVAVSPVVTIEPRRRKFHKPITLTIPLPKPATRGMTNPGESPTLRLLCSITGGVQPATWEDITGSTPLSYVKDCVSFTTTVSARFWLMDCPNTTESADMAGRLYREAFLVPYMGRFVIFAKRTEADEAKLRCFCITDDKVDKTLECNEGFERKAESREVEVLDGKPQWIEGVGNLVPVTKNGDQFFLPFRAFRENRLAFPIKIKDVSQPAVGKVAFLKDPRPTKPTDSPSLKPICTLEVVLPDHHSDGSAPRAPKTPTELEPELLSFTTDHIARSELDLRDIAESVRADWPMLARELGVGQSDITNAKVNFRDDRDRAFAVLCQWQRERGSQATGNEMERALRRIGRDDVVKRCMRNVEYVVEEDEKRQAKSLLDRQEQEERLSSRASQPPEEEEEGGGKIVANFDERHGPPPAEKSSEEKARDQAAKQEAFLSLIDSMNSMTPEPEVHIPGRGDADGGDAVDEFDIAPVSLTKVDDPAAVEELLGKLDSLPVHSMAPEGDEEVVDTPQTVAVSHSAPPAARSATPPQRETPPPSPIEGDPVETADDTELKEQARRFVENLVEREGDMQAELDDHEDGNQDQHGEEEKGRQSQHQEPAGADDGEELDSQHHHSLNLRRELVSAAPPQEFVEEEEFEEELPDGSVVRKHVVRRRLVQEVTERIVAEGCHPGLTDLSAAAAVGSAEGGDAGGVDKSGGGNQDEEEEMVVEEETEDELPDGSVVRRRVITRTRRDVVRIVSDGKDGEDDNDDDEEEDADQQLRATAARIVAEAIQGALQLEGATTEGIQHPESIIQDDEVNEPEPQSTPVPVPESEAEPVAADKEESDPAATTDEASPESEQAPAEISAEASAAAPAAASTSAPQDADQAAGQQGKRKQRRNQKKKR